MAKEERSYSKEFKKQSILIYITMGLVIVCCILGFITACSGNSKENDFDTSMMRSVGVKEVEEMFEDGDTYVLYIGRETCEACNEFLPVLKEAQIENNYITQYMDITQIDRKSSSWKELIKKFDIEVTTASSEDATETVTDTYGNLLDTKGYTPCIIIIKDGKQVAGYIGVKSETSFQDWLDEYGV